MTRIDDSTLDSFAKNPPASLCCRSRHCGVASSTPHSSAVAGMCGGFLISVLWKIFFSEATGLYEMVPGFFGGIIVIILVSLFTRPPVRAAGDMEYVVRSVREYGR